LLLLPAPPSAELRVLRGRLAAADARGVVWVVGVLMLLLYAFTVRAALVVPADPERLRDGG
jgi:hypothetical protein